jgi:peptidoglycan/LPS O-acetylase OafA/YrhL
MEYLDGLRGLAALAVVIFHMNTFFSALTWERADFAYEVLRRITNANFAVCIFFILSGFVLSRPFLKGGDSSRLGEAALRRYFRLTPPALVSVLLAFIIWITIGFPVKEMVEFGPGFAWESDLYNFIPSLTGALYNGLVGIYLPSSITDISYNGVLWSLRVELYGSMFLFGFIALFGKSKFICTIAIIFSVVLIYTLSSTGIYVSLFLAGYLLNTVSESSKHLAWEKYLVLPALYLGSLDQWCQDGLFLREYFAFLWGGEWDFNHTIFPHAIGAVLLLFSILRGRLLKNIFSLKLFLLLGRWSFSLYVVHIVVILSIGNCIFASLARTGHYRLGALCAIVAVFIIVFALSEILQRTVDLPSQKLAKKIASLILRTKHSR